MAAKAAIGLKGLTQKSVSTLHWQVLLSVLGMAISQRHMNAENITLISQQDPGR